MMELLLTAAFILAVYFFNWFYLAPKRLYDHYYKVLTAKGYKVYAPAFNPFNAPLMMRILKGVSTHRDAFHVFKHDLVGYDVALTNISNQIELGIINPKLAQSFNNAESLMTVQKDVSFFGMIKQACGNSLLFMEGDEWKNRKKVLSKVFTHSFIMSQIPNFVKIFQEMLDREELKSQQKSQDGTKIKVDLESLLSSAFGKVVVSLFLGTNLDDETVEGLPLEEAIKQMSALSMKLCFHPLVIVFGATAAGMNFNADCRRFNKLREGVKGKLRALVSRMVQEKKNNSGNSENQTIIGNLIEHLKDTPNFEESLADEIYLFTIVGQDTTTTVVTSTLYYLFEKAHILEKLRTEISSTIGVNEPITAAHIKDLKYLENVLKEANRVAGPLPSIYTRKAMQDILVADIPVRKGTKLNYLFRANFFDPKYFEEPFEFRPERMDQPRYREPEMQQVIESAFSIGPKTCIGKHLAHLEAKIMVVKFLERYSGMKELQERVMTVSTLGQYEKSDVEVTKTGL